MQSSGSGRHSTGTPSYVYINLPSITMLLVPERMLMSANFVADRGQA